MLTWQKVVLALSCSGVVGVGVGAGLALAAPQPHMQTALVHLQTARSELDQAAADKGGYRIMALADCDAAIADVQKGLAYASSH